LFYSQQTPNKDYPNLPIIPQTKNPTNVGLDDSGVMRLIIVDIQVQNHATRFSRTVG